MSSIPTQDPLIKEFGKTSGGMYPTWAPFDEGLRTVPLHEVARFYGMGLSTLRRYAHQGKIRTVRIGRKNHMTVHAIRLFLAGQ